MSSDMLMALLCDGGVAGGGWLTVHGLMRTERDTETSRRRPAWLLHLRGRFGRRRVVGALTAGGVVGAVTGWPVGALLASLAGLVLPDALGRDRRNADRTARLEAVAVWAEMLRDTLSAAAGLEQAVIITAALAPPALRARTTVLAARIEKGEPLGVSLRVFAEEVADPVADTVVAALVTAAERQARQLAPLLGSLAAATRDQVAMRLRIDAGRARVRTSVRVITGTTLGMAVGLILLNRPYLAPFGSFQGQLVLTVVGGLFAGGFAWLMKIAEFAEEPRILAAGPITAASARATPAKAGGAG